MASVSDCTRPATNPSLTPLLPSRVRRLGAALGPSEAGPLNPKTGLWRLVAG
jgi:hypothetical protein